MTDNKPAYTVRIAEADGKTRYFAAFVDGSGIRQEAEINREIYFALEDCRRKEKRQSKFHDRHVEHLELSENQLAQRMAEPSNPLDMLIDTSVTLQAAIDALPSDLRRRFLLYHEMGLGFTEIAKAENLSKQAIAQSIGRAEEKIKKYFSDGC
jgi:DNA-directed RNA polymerase specialized sigma24 family protein